MLLAAWCLFSNTSSLSQSCYPFVGLFHGVCHHGYLVVSWISRPVLHTSTIASLHVAVNASWAVSHELTTLVWYATLVDVFFDDTAVIDFFQLSLEVFNFILECLQIVLHLGLRTSCLLYSFFTRVSSWLLRLERVTIFGKPWYSFRLTWSRLLRLFDFDGMRFFHLFNRGSDSAQVVMVFDVVLGSLLWNWLRRVLWHRFDQRVLRGGEVGINLMTVVLCAKPVLLILTAFLIQMEVLYATFIPNVCFRCRDRLIRR